MLVATNRGFTPSVEIAATVAALVFHTVKIRNMQPRYEEQQHLSGERKAHPFVLRIGIIVSNSQDYAVGDPQYRP